MEITYEKQGNVGVFTIDNGKLNLLTEKMHQQLHDKLTNFLSDDSVKVGVLTGQKGKCFSAGDDLNEGDSYGEGGGWSIEVMRMARDKPIVGAVNGWCLGQGFIYLMRLTDLRIAGQGASMGLPEIAYGMGGAGGSLRLSRYIPSVTANWLALTGEKLSAKRALDSHLVNEVVDDDSVFDRAMEVANMIANHPLIAIKTEMDCMQQCADMTALEAGDYALEQYERQIQFHKDQTDGMDGIDHLRSAKKESTEHESGRIRKLL